MANFCEHCQGQRFDRARVLRTLRQVRLELRDLRHGANAEQAIAAAIRAISELEIPHLDPEEEESQVVH
jgi:hypothetical protein